ncbi:MAG: hypothetical protein ABRQ38_12330 [Candidatus Eremiobacterota bacterium]
MALTGYGSIFKNLLFRLFKDKSEKFDKNLLIPVQGILGMIIVTTMATTINFFLPVNQIISLIFLSTGVILFIINRKNIFYRISREHINLFIILAGILFIIIPFSWNEAYDTGLYHLPAMKWITSTSVPAGLANLHSRLGYNSSWFVLAACIDQWVIITDKPFFLLNGLMTFYYIFLFAIILKEKFLKKEILNNYLFADLFLLLSFFTFIFPLKYLICSLYTDLPVIILTVFVLYLVSYDLESNSSFSSYTFLSTIISAYGLTIKSTALPLFLTCIFIALLRPLIEKLKTRTYNIKYNIKTLIICVTLLSVIFIPWIARGVMLSGYLFYPVSTGYLPGLSWSVPAEKAQERINADINWSRYRNGCSISNSSSQWIWLWFKRYIKMFVVIFTIAITGICLILISAYRKKLSIDKEIIWIIPFIIASSGILFWFLTIPGPRYGYGYLFSWALLLFSAGLWRSGILEVKKMQKFYRVAITVFILIIFIILIFSDILLPSYIRKENKVKKMTWKEFNLPQVEMVEKHTGDGISIYLPSRSDQCWNAKLPNTPEFNPDLKIKFSPVTGLPEKLWVINK